MQEKVNPDSASVQNCSLFILGAALKRRRPADRFDFFRNHLPFLGLTGQQMSQVASASWSRGGAPLEPWRVPGLYILSDGEGTHKHITVVQEVDSSSETSKAIGMVDEALPLSVSSAFSPLLQLMSQNRYPRYTVDGESVPGHRVEQLRVQPSLPGRNLGEVRNLHREASGESSTAVQRSGSTIDLVTTHMGQDSVPMPSADVLPQRTHNRLPTYQEDGRNIRPDASTALGKRSSSVTPPYRMKEDSQFGLPIKSIFPRSGNVQLSSRVGSSPTVLRFSRAFAMSTINNSPRAICGLLQSTGKRNSMLREGKSQLADPKLTSLPIGFTNAMANPRISERPGTNGSSHLLKNDVGEDSINLPDWRSYGKQQDPGPYARKRLQGLRIDTAAAEKIIEHKVNASIERLKGTLSPQAQRPSEVRFDPMTHIVNNDEVLRRIMQRMHTLAQEERFRIGKLR